MSAAAHTSPLPPLAGADAGQKEAHQRQTPPGRSTARRRSDGRSRTTRGCARARSGRRCQNRPRVRRPVEDHFGQHPVGGARHCRRRTPESASENGNVRVERVRARRPGSSSRPVTAMLTPNRPTTTTREQQARASPRAASAAATALPDAAIGSDQQHVRRLRERGDAEQHRRQRRPTRRSEQPARGRAAAPRRRRHFLVEPAEVARAVTSDEVEQLGRDPHEVAPARPTPARTPSATAPSATGDRARSGTGSAHRHDQRQQHGVEHEEPVGAEQEDERRGGRAGRCTPCRSRAASDRGSGCARDRARTARPPPSASVGIVAPASSGRRLSGPLGNSRHTRTRSSRRYVEVAVLGEAVPHHVVGRLVALEAQAARGSRP